MKIPLTAYWQLLRTYLRPYWLKVTLLGVLLFGGIGLQLYTPQLLRSFIDAATTAQPMSLLTRLAIIYLVLSLLNQVLSAAATYVSQDVAWSTTNQLRADLAEHCLHLDMTFHKTHTAGAMIERIDGDVNSLANFFSQFVLRVLGSGVLLMGVLILLWREEWRLGLGLTVISLAMVFVINRMRNVAVPYITAERQANADLYGFLEERLAGTEDIRANGATSYVLGQLEQRLGTLLRTGRSAWMWGSSTWPVTNLLYTLSTAVALAFSGYLFLQGTMTIGTVFLIFNYTGMLQRPLEQLARQMEDLQKAGAGIARIQELLAQASRLHPGQRTGMPPGPLAVAVDGVSFAYDDDPERGADEALDLVLRAVDFQLQPGRVLGLLGRTGSGKTTLTRLLCRLYDPTAGQIHLGDAALTELTLPALRRRVGMVTQDVQLFHGTVRDNLTLYDATITDDHILDVIRELGLQSWYEDLPHGLDTVLAGGGSSLSAGEAQLLAFTRIFLRDPGLVIMDEASSRLDPVTEQLAERAVDRLLRDRTAIIIAHRLGTVQRADEIMILDQGRILEHGDRIALAADPTSRFASLLRTGMEEALV